MGKIDSIYDLLISSVKIYESLGCNANCLLTLLAKMNDIFLKEAFRFFKHCAKAQVLCIWQYIIHLYLRYLVFYNYLSIYICCFHFQPLSWKMELTFAYFMEVIVTPLTVLIGLLGNGLSILVLNKKEIQLRGSFSRILIALSVFDITFITSSAVLFSLR